MDDHIEFAFAGEVKGALWVRGRGDVGPIVCKPAARWGGCVLSVCCIGLSTDACTLQWSRCEEAETVPGGSHKTQ